MPGQSRFVPPSPRRGRQRSIYAGAPMVLFLHNRYRVTGGEERTVADLQWLVREHLHEAAELLSRTSRDTTRPTAAAGLLRGGLKPAEVADAVRLSGARIVHAHNLHPTFGWRALAAAREAGARVVLHLHQYRLVCANGVCFTGGADCTRCHRRNTLPGVLHNCRSARAEAVAYGAALALWQTRIAEHADAVIVPSKFAVERLRALGAPLDPQRVQVLAPPLRTLDDDDVQDAPRVPAPDAAPVDAREAARERGAYALVAA